MRFTQPIATRLMVGPGPPTGSRVEVDATDPAGGVIRFTGPTGKVYTAAAYDDGAGTSTLRIGDEAGAPELILGELPTLETFARLAADLLQLDGSLDVQTFTWTPDVRNTGGPGPVQGIDLLARGLVGNWCAAELNVELLGVGLGATAITFTLPYPVAPDIDAAAGGAVLGTFFFFDASALINRTGIVYSVTGSPTIGRLMTDGAGGTLAIQLGNLDRLRVALHYRADV